MISRALTTLIMVLLVAIIISLIVLFKVPLKVEQVACFVFGIISAGVFALGWFRLNDWIGDATSPGRPQTMRLQTDDTPAHITWAAVRATLMLFVICMALLMIFMMIMSQLLGIDFVQLLS